MSSIIPVLSESLQIIGLAGIVLLIVLLLIALMSRERGGWKRGKLMAYTESFKNLLEGRVERAIDILTGIVKKDPDSVDTYYIIGNLMRLAGKTDRAIHIHRNILLREKLSEKKRNEAIKSLALDLKKGGQIEKAAKELEVLARKEPNNPNILKLLEELYLETDDLERAYDIRMKISKIQKKSFHNILSHLLVNMGRKALEKGNPGIARKLFKKGISLYNLSEDALLNYARLQLEEGDLEGAQKTLASIWDINPSLSFLTLPMMEEIYFKMGKFTEFGDFLAARLERNPDMPRVRLALAKFLVNMGRGDEAEKELRTILDRSPSLMEAWEEFLKLVVSKGDRSQLESTLKTFFNTFRQEEIFSCRECGYKSREIFWYCPGCNRWDTLTVTC